MRAFITGVSKRNIGVAKAIIKAAEATRFLCVWVMQMAQAMQCRCLTYFRRQVEDALESFKHYVLHGFVFTAV
jgi:hypothetical protein